MKKFIEENLENLVSCVIPVYLGVFVIVSAFEFNDVSYILFCLVLGGGLLFVAGIFIELWYKEYKEESGK